jgi:hypothetical protein
MTKSIRIECTSRPPGIVACVYDKAGGPGTDTFVTAYYLPDANPVSLSISSTQYVIVRDVDDASVKSIDNWSTNPPPNQ